ncbi:hypothetical protein FPV67DRAFT_433242 [Lyophyllum atratum]|nr:hypothetical protein FPV67DRAFT_433242 [Lyophyllum atratum]
MSRTPSPNAGSARKKPHCHSCGLPMAGHKRPDGLPLCPVKDESLSPPPSYASPPPSTQVSSTHSYSSLFSGSLSSLASPPVTPPRQRTPSAIRAPVSDSNPSPKRLLDPAFDIPESGAWHRRNPNWIDPPLMVARVPAPAGSIVSTVLVDDDGKTIRGRNDDDYEEDDDGASVSSSFFGHVAQNLKNRRVVSMFATKRTDPARTQQLAAKQGMHAALVRLPAGNVPLTKKKVDGSWWMVVGRDAGVVGRIVDKSQRGMPGGMELMPAQGPHLTTFLQLILAGLIGGIVTVCGLSYL